MDECWRHRSPASRSRLTKASGSEQFAWQIERHPILSALHPPSVLGEHWHIASYLVFWQHIAGRGRPPLTTTFGICRYKQTTNFATATMLGQQTAFQDCKTLCCTTLGIRCHKIKLDKAGAHHLAQGSSVKQAELITQVNQSEDSLHLSKFSSDIIMRNKDLLLSGGKEPNYMHTYKS